MSEELEFRHISVSSDNDDEVVIQAGAVDRDEGRPASETTAATEPELSSTAVAETPSRDDTAFAPSGTSKGISAHPSSSVLAEAGLEVDDISEEARKEYEEHMRRSAKRAEASRMITTEEDLHATVPFARMQRIVMVVFALLIVAAVAYWFVRHTAS